MARSQRRKFMGSRKKNQRNNKRLRINSKKRMKNRNKNILSRKLRKRYQRGGSVLDGGGDANNNQVSGGVSGSNNPVTSNVSSNNQVSGGVSGSNNPFAPPGQVKPSTRKRLVNLLGVLHLFMELLLPWTHTKFGYSIFSWRRCSWHDFSR